MAPKAQLVATDGPQIPYVIETRDTPHTYRLNVQPSPFDPRDYLAGTPVDRIAAKLPPLAMFQWTPPKKDQGQEGSCTGNAISGMFEYELYKLFPASYAEMSAAYVYARERIIEGDLDQDAGAWPRDGFTTLRHFGCCAESLMPYRAGDFSAAPSAQADADALKHRIKAYYRIVSPHTVKQDLAKGIAVCIGMLVFNGMMVSRNGVIPMPAANEQPLGGHCVYYTGYCDRPDWPGGGYFRIQNSWGTSAGDGGNYYLPYAYDASTQLVSERWRLTL